MVSYDEASLTTLTDFEYETEDNSNSERNPTSLRVRGQVIAVSVFMVVEAVVGIVGISVALWILITTSNIQQITGDLFRNTVICIAVLSVLQSSGVLFGLCGAVRKIVFLVVACCSLHVALIISVFITALYIYLEKHKFLEDVNLGFNRVDNDLISTLNEMFACQVSDAGSGDEWIICEDNIRDWLSNAIIIILGCCGAEIMSMLFVLVISCSLQKKLYKWIYNGRRTEQIRRSSRIAPGNIPTAPPCHELIRYNHNRDSIDLTGYWYKSVIDSF